MKTQPITEAEFMSTFSQPGRPKGPLAKAIQALTPGTGFKTSCIWNHGKARSDCRAAGSARRAGHRAGLSIQAVCRNGTLMVFRPTANEEEECQRKRLARITAWESS